MPVNLESLLMSDPCHGWSLVNAGSLSLPDYGVVGRQQQEVAR